MVDEGKKIRCLEPSCRKVLGVLKKDMLEIQCPRCGLKHLWDHNKKRLIRVIKE